MCKDESNIAQLREMLPTLASTRRQMRGFAIYEAGTGCVFGRGLMNIKGVAVQDAYITPGCVFAPHHHQMVEHTICYKGELLIDVDGEQVSLSPGEILTIEPNTPHGFSSETGAWVIAVTIPADDGYPDGP